MNAKFLFFLFVVTAIYACGDNEDALKNSIININKECPVVCDNWTVDSLGVSKNGEIVYFCNSTNNADYMILLKTKKDSIRNALVESINNNKYDNASKLIQICKKHNAGLVYKFYSNVTKETVVIKIPVTKLVADPARN